MRTHCTLERVERMDGLMATPLHVLIVDDSEDDARLLVRELTRGGYAVTSRRVDTAEGLARALSDIWQVVLCDFTMPRFTGDEALRLVKVSGLGLPFIYVSGTIGEEVAVEAMMAGAQDYVMKDRLTRLAPAVDRAVREAEARRRAEQDLRRQTRINEALFTQSIAALLVFDRSGRIVQVNDAYAHRYHQTPAWFVGRHVSELDWAGVDADRAQAILDDAVRTGTAQRFASQLRAHADSPDRTGASWDAILQPILDDSGEVEFLFFSAIDVTEKRRAGV